MGALVGGPDENDIFVNNRTDFVRNEVALGLFIVIDKFDEGSFRLQRSFNIDSSADARPRAWQCGLKWEDAAAVLYRKPKIKLHLVTVDL